MSLRRGRLRATADAWIVGMSAALVILPLAGCTPYGGANAGAGTESSAPIRTTEPSYAFRRGADALELAIAAVYTNPTDETVYIARCGTDAPAFTLEKRIDEEWRSAYVPICPMILVPPIEVGPGESHADSIRLSAGIDPNTAPRLEVDSIPGIYRLVYSIFSRWDAGTGLLDGSLPEEDRVSPPFTIEG